MRILMLNPFLWPYSGGTENHVWEVARRLKNHDITILTAQLKDTPSEEEKEGVRIVRSPSWVLRDLPKPLPPPVPLMWRHAEDLKKLAVDSDCIHGHNRFFYGLQPLTIAKKFGKKIAWTLHNSRPEGIDFATDFCGKAFDDVIGKTLLSQCDLVLGVSQYTLDSTLPKCFRGVSAVAYNGVDNKLFKPHESNVCNELDSVHTALCIARFVKQKGLDYLIEAFSRLNATLVLIGRGPEEKNLRRKAKEVGAKVFFITQRVSEQVLADYYAACDVFVLPSLWEPFGIVLVEAMASAKPIVATNVGGIPEIVSAKEGFLVPPKNTSALSQGIRFLLENPRKAKAMGVAGRKKALRKFTWDETAKAYEKAYQQLG